MRLFDRLRALLGLGDRRLRGKLGLAPDRRRGPRDRRDEEGSRAEALGDLEALAREKAERDAAAIRELERARDEGRVSGSSSGSSAPSPGATDRPPSS